MSLLDHSWLLSESMEKSLRTGKRQTSLIFKKTGQGQEGEPRQLLACQALLKPWGGDRTNPGNHLQSREGHGSH